jgi:phosphatidylinositol 4-kinase A
VAPQEERKAAAVRFLEEVHVPRDDIFIPTNQNFRILAVKPETAAPMQSAAKCPILVAFDVEQELAEEEVRAEQVKACIFKVGDDCRQDLLALQVGYM